MTGKEIKKKLEDKFGDRISVEQGAIDKQFFILVKDIRDNRDVVRYLFKELEARMNIMTGIDSRNGVEILYHMSFDKYNCIFTVKVLAEKPFPSVDSITDIVPGAKWIEREIYELYDVKFKGTAFGDIV